jgi:hypothetical protein
MNLTLSQVVEIYLADLAKLGVHAIHPADPINDPDWKQTLERTYPQPLSPHAGDDLV